jgi:hypothetical protein
MSITDELLAELAAEAGMATDGPWTADVSPVGGLYISGPCDEFICGAIDHVHDANFIALASPATILAMLAERGRLLNALDNIGGLSRALRVNGPDPMDLQGLSDALNEAVDIAHAAMDATP